MCKYHSAHCEFIFSIPFASCMYDESKSTFTCDVCDCVFVFSSTSINFVHCINNFRRIGGGKRQECCSVHNVDEQATRCRRWCCWPSSCYEFQIIIFDGKQRSGERIYFFQFLTRLVICNRFQQNITYQGNLFLNCNDVTLQNIDCIYQIVDRKKRLINPYSKISSKLEGLQVVCKVSDFCLLSGGLACCVIGNSFYRISGCWILASNDRRSAKANALPRRWPNSPFQINMICYLRINIGKYNCDQ